MFILLFCDEHAKGKYGHCFTFLNFIGKQSIQDVCMRVDFLRTCTFQVIDMEIVLEVHGVKIGPPGTE